MPKIPTSADLMKHAATAVTASRQHLWTTIRPDQAFSWQTLLFLSLFSWLMALFASDAPLLSDAPSEGIGQLSLQGSPTKYALFTMGWIFLTLAIAWLLSGSRLKIPLFDLVLRPAAWVAAAIPCIFGFQVWYDNNFEPALTAWPILAAIFYLLPRCASSKGGYKIPKVSERQHLLIIVLVSLLLSCWIRFYFLVQDWVDGNSSAFKPMLPGLEVATDDLPDTLETIAEPAPAAEPQTASPTNASPTNARPADIAESVIASQLEALPLPEIRQRLRTDLTLVETLNAQFDNALAAAQQNPGWTLQISQVVPSPLSFQLQVVPPPAPSEAAGNTPITRTCRVSPVDNPGGAQLSRLECLGAPSQ